MDSVRVGEANRFVPRATEGGGHKMTPDELDDQREKHESLAMHFETSMPGMRVRRRSISTNGSPIRGGDDGKPVLLGLLNVPPLPPRNVVDCVEADSEGMEALVDDIERPTSAPPSLRHMNTFGQPGMLGLFSNWGAPSNDVRTRSSASSHLKSSSFDPNAIWAPSLNQSPGSFLAPLSSVSSGGSPVPRGSFAAPATSCYRGSSFESNWYPGDETAVFSPSGHGARGVHGEQQMTNAFRGMNLHSPPPPSGHSPRSVHEYMGNVFSPPGLETTQTPSQHGHQQFEQSLPHPPLEGYDAHFSLQPNFMLNHSMYHPGPSSTSSSPDSTPMGLAGTSLQGHLPPLSMPSAQMHSTSPNSASNRAGRGSTAICKFFANGSCVRGENCRFAHVTATKGTRMMGARSTLPNGSRAQPATDNVGVMATYGAATTGRRAKKQGHPVMAEGEVQCAAVAEVLGQLASGASADDLEGKVHTLAKDQHGCRLLQRLLDESTPCDRVTIIDRVYSEVFGHLNMLMTDPFGNYLCQKLIQYCSESQRVAMMQKVAPDLVAVSLSIHGTRVVQKLVEIMNTPEEVGIMIRSLSTSVVTLAKDLNGNHVIQRCLHHLSAGDNQFIYDSVALHLVSVATHKHGCCVLQRCIDYATLKQRALLVDNVLANVLELVQDAFGNYVVQYVLEIGDRRVARQVMEQLLGNVSNLSVQKFSSNVVEKCLQIADDDIREAMSRELCSPERLPRLLADPYANYVIQKALDVSQPEEFDRLARVIRPHIAALKSTSFGKRIQSKIVKRFPALDPGSQYIDDGQGIAAF